VEVVTQTHDSFLSGLAYYEDRPDKGYSLTDCVSMTVMRVRGLTDVLTNDEHFRQEGFRAALKTLVAPRYNLLYYPILTAPR
jgi:uncharacterized protein